MFSFLTRPTYRGETRRRNVTRLAVASGCRRGRPCRAILFRLREEGSRRRFIRRMRRGGAPQFSYPDRLDRRRLRGRE